MEKHLRIVSAFVAASSLPDLNPNFVDDTLSLVSNHLRRLPPQDACSHRAADWSNPRCVDHQHAFGRLLESWCGNAAVGFWLLPAKFPTASEPLSRPLRSGLTASSHEDVGWQL